MNIELLRKVQQQIKQEPAQFAMSSFFIDDAYLAEEGWQEDMKRVIPNCGTAACIAGWAIAISANLNPRDAEKTMGSGWRDGERALDITKDQSEHLFVVSNWPLEFNHRWHEAQTLYERAIVACDRIDYFIENEE